MLRDDNRMRGRVKGTGRATRRERIACALISLIYALGSSGAVLWIGELGVAIAAERGGASPATNPASPVNNLASPANNPASPASNPGCGCACVLRCSLDCCCARRAAATSTRPLREAAREAQEAKAPSTLISSCGFPVQGSLPSGAVILAPHVAAERLAQNSMPPRSTAAAAGEERLRPQRSPGPAEAVPRDLALV